MNKKEVKRMFKMGKAELESYLNRQRNAAFKPKKGRGSYARKKKDSDLESFSVWFTPVPIRSRNA